MKIVPTPRQQEFLASNADIVCFGGNRGGGKSHALILDAMGLNDTKFGPRIALPHYKALICRKYYVGLDDLVNKSKIIYPQIDKGAQFYSSKDSMYWKFSSGATIRFMYFEDINQAAEKLQGKEFDYLAVDEAGLYEDDKVFRFCMSVLRNPYGLKTYLRLTTNPSKNKWLQNFFKIDATGNDTNFKIEHELPDGSLAYTSVRFIRSKLEDNPYLGKEYTVALMNLDEQTKQAHLYGRWDAFDFSDATIYKKEYQQLESENRITTVRLQQGFDTYVAFDLGWADYTSVIVFQICGKELHILDSFENNNEQIDWYVAELKRKGYTENIKIIVPHDAAQKSLQTGLSMQEKLEKFYPPTDITILARTGIEDGIKNVREKFPYFYIDKTKNELLIECIKNYERTYNSKSDQYGEPLHNKYSHMADALRYMCAYIPEKPRATWTIGTHIPRTI